MTVKKIYTVCLLILFCTTFSASTLSNTLEECMKESGVSDRLEAKKWWDISSAVIAAFKNESSQDLAALMKGPLMVGPTRQELLNNDLRTFFSSAVIYEIASEAPLCARFNSQGAMLGNGHVWVEQRGEAMALVSAPSAIEIPFSYGRSGVPRLPDGGVIHPRCIEVVWSSGDNFEAYAEKYGIPYEELVNAPLARVSRAFTIGFCPPWLLEGNVCTSELRLALLKGIDKCSLPDSNVDKKLLDSQIVRPREIHADDEERSYRVLGIQPEKVCQRLIARGLKATACFFTAKSLGRKGDAYALHALINDRYIAPVRFFDNASEIREFLDPSEISKTESLCDAQFPVFQCSFKETGKSVAICESSDPAAFTYRFGQPGRVELTIPINTKNTSLTYENLDSAWFWSMKIRRGKYQYVLTDSQGISARLSVVKGNEELAGWFCESGDDGFALGQVLEQLHDSGYPRKEP